MQGSFIVYVLQNPKKKKYIGMTSDLDHRLNKHNKDLSTYTSKKGPWQIAWASKEMSHSNALKLEKLMKRQKGGIGLKRLMEENLYSS